MALVGCTQMATDMIGLLQQMLPRLDALQSLSYSKHHMRIETTAKHSDVAKLVYHASMTELVLPRLQTCQRRSM